MSEMRYKREVVRQERSLGVNARVDVVELAEIAIAFYSLNIPMKSISHLMAMVVHQFHVALVDQDIIETEDRLDGLRVAWDVLRSYGLTTKSMEKQNEKKILMGKAFENLRREGVDPEFYAPHVYKQLHNEKSVTPVGMAGETVAFDINEMEKIYHDLERKEKEGDKPEETDEERVARLHGMSVEDWRKMVSSSEYKEKQAKIKAEREERKRLADLQIEKNRAARRQKEIEEKARDKAMKKAAKLKAECEILEEQEKGVLEIADSNEPRPLSDEELNAKGKDIESRDRDLATIDMSAPKQK